MVLECQATARPARKAQIARDPVIRKAIADTHTGTVTVAT